MGSRIDSEARTAHNGDRMWALLFALSVATPASTPPPRLWQRLREAPRGPARVVRATDLLVGVPYEKHPLGEGEGPDPQPRFRLDAFDCQTFVETALALGEAEDERAAHAILDDIRYAGAPSFVQRNHYMMSQWVPSNLSKGYLALPPDERPVAEKVITEQSWKSRSPRSIDLPQDRVPLGRFTLPLTDLDTLEAGARAIPSGTVMLIVREDRPRNPDRVTHLGFVIQRGQETFYRHASDVFKRVVDEPLAHFIARNRRYAYQVSGVALLEPRANEARVETLK